MIIVEKSGKTVDEAVYEALKELNTEKENVEIEVICEGKKGILGIGAEDAKVRVKMEENPLSKAQKYVNEVMNLFGIDVKTEASF